MVECDDAGKAPFHLRRAVRSLMMVGWGISGKLWLAFGTLLLVMVVGGFVSSLYIEEIDRKLRQVVEIEEPLEQAFLEMEINAGETALAVLDYIRDQDPKHLETIRDAEADYARFAAEFERLSETDAERQLGREVARFYREFKVLGIEIVGLANERRSALETFRRDVLEIDELIDEKLQKAIDMTTPDGMKKPHSALDMEEALRKSEERFRDVASVASDWLWETDRNHRFVYISDRFFQAMEVVPETVIGNSRQGFIQDRELEAHPEKWRRHFEDVGMRPRQAIQQASQGLRIWGLDPDGEANERPSA